MSGLMSVLEGAAVSAANGAAANGAATQGAAAAAPAAAAPATAAPAAQPAAAVAEQNQVTTGNAAADPALQDQVSVRHRIRGRGARQKLTG